MDIKTLFTLPDSLKYIYGIESTLRKRRRNSLVATIATVLAGIFNTVKELMDGETVEQYLSNFLKYTINAFKCLLYIISFKWDLLSDYKFAYDTIGIYIIITGIVIYYLYRHTSFLFKISEEPFQYTFWIKKFKKVEENSKFVHPVTAQIDNLLDHDLMDMLNRRIRRFSLLDESKLPEGTEKNSEINNTPPTHINVDGHYAIRYREYDDKIVQVIQVLPRVRIGPTGNPSLLTYPVEVELVNENQSMPQENELEKGSSEEDNDKTNPNEQTKYDSLSQNTYNQILEQVYSKVASEIYRQIKSDIEKKIHLFPSKYLRAVALYFEADDFSRSNTIDSYDYAIELYNQALRYYHISWRSVTSNWLIYFKLFRMGIKFEMMRARTKIGYAKSIIYRREISSLTGRTINTLFNVPLELKKVINKLIRIHNKFHWWNLKPNLNQELINTRKQEKSQIQNKRRIAEFSFKFKKDTWKNKYLLRKPDTSKFEKLKDLIFDANVVLAFAYSNLGDIEQAKEYIDVARAIAPEKCNKNSLFLLAKADAEMDLNLKKSLLIQSTEIDPNFEIAQYLLARCLVKLLYMNGEIERERTYHVRNEFKKVLNINPSNIAAYAYLGYLYWLIDDLDQAQKNFEHGIKIKAIVKQTFIGELNYGLARIAAKHGEFNKCYDLYKEALSAEPGIGTYGIYSVEGKTRSLSFYEYISRDILDRYKLYKENFEEQIHLKLHKICKNDIPDFNRFLDAIKTSTDTLGIFLRNEYFKNIDSHNHDQIIENLNNFLSDERTIEIANQNHEEYKILETIYYFDEKLKCIKCFNRLLLNSIFQKFIKISEDQDHLISLRTLSECYSFVLNDYGNACLNYFHRFGYKWVIEEAVTYYEKAKKLNPTNGIVNYNLVNAYGWKYGWENYHGFIKRKECIEKADDLISSPWPSKILERERHRISEYGWKISDLKYEIPKLSSQREDEKKSTENLEITYHEKYKTRKIIERSLRSLDDKKIRYKDSSQDLTPETFDIDDILQDTIRLNVISQKSKYKEDYKDDILHDTISQKTKYRENYKILSQEKTILDTKLDEIKNDIDRKNAKIRELDVQLAEKKDELQKWERNFDNDFIFGLRRIIEISKFASLIDCSSIDTKGKCAEKIIGINNDSERLDEIDIDSIIAWADLFNNNQWEPEAIDTSIKLCEYIYKFYPNSFNTDRIFLTALEKKEILEIENDLKNIDRTESRDINNFKSPYFKISDLKSPLSILAKLDCLTGYVLTDISLDNLRSDGIKSEILHKLEEIKNKEYINSEKFIEQIKKTLGKLYRKTIEKYDILKYAESELKSSAKNLISSYDNKNYFKNKKNLQFELSLLLNKLIKTHFYENYSSFFKVKSKRIRKLIEFELDHKLEGIDLVRFNRRLLEEHFTPFIKSSKIESLREKICTTIQENWTKDDPLSYLSLDPWGKYYLNFPEYENLVKESINYAQLCSKKSHFNLNEIISSYHLLLSELYENQKSNKDVISKLEIAKKEYPDQAIYYTKLSQFYCQERKFQEAIHTINEAKKLQLLNRTKWDEELKEIYKYEANISIDNNELEKAISILESGLEKFKGDATLSDLLDRTKMDNIRNKVKNHYGEKWMRLTPSVTRVAVEVAEDLIPYIETEDGNLPIPLGEMIEWMRNRIFQEYGVRIPEIRFRGNEYDLPDGTYIFMIDEIPLISGNISLEQRLFYGKHHELVSLGIQGEESYDPLTGKKVYWISKKDTRKLGELNERLMEIMEFPIRHIESIIQQNLVQFLGHQEVNDLIKDYDYNQFEYLNTHPEISSRLTTLLRGMISQKVPIAEFKIILDYFMSHEREEKNITNLINNIRLLPEIRKTLPGIRGKSLYRRLSPSLEEEFNKSKYEDNGNYLFAMEPEVCQNVLTAIRSEISNIKSATLVVENTMLRPLVRQLLQLEFPNTSIISRQEFEDQFGEQFEKLKEVDF